MGAISKFGIFCDRSYQGTTISKCQILNNSSIKCGTQIWRGTVVTWRIYPNLDLYIHLSARMFPTYWKNKHTICSKFGLRCWLKLSKRLFAIFRIVHLTRFIISQLLLLLFIAEKEHEEFFNGTHSKFLPQLDLFNFIAENPIIVFQCSK